MRIVYMGTPDFAQPCLKKLVDCGYEIPGVFCQPDKPQGRKMIITPPPVKVTAQELSLNVYQPVSLRNDESYNLLKELNPDLIVVVAYGKILPENILNLPKYGCINVHASLLPELRGAAPIQWSVINGNKITGITTMQMNAGLDTGDILLTESVEIGPDETSEELWDRLSLLAPDLLIDTINGVVEGTISPVSQDDSRSSYAPLLSKDISPIDWNKTCDDVHNLIRGLFSWPCANAVINGKKVKVLRSKLQKDKNGKPGEVLQSESSLVVACGYGAVEILCLQPEGKKAMSTSDFLRGNKIPVGTILK